MHNEVSTSIIKADRIGRAHYSQQYKDEALAAFDQSSLSGPAFAQQCGVKYPTFASWISKRRRVEQPPGRSELGEAKPSPAFLMAEVAQGMSVPALKIALPGNAVLHLTDTSQIPLVAELLRTLA